MALETLEFDAAGSNVDGTNPGTALVVSSTTANYGVTAFSSPAPAPKLLWASSIDTDGARRADPSTYENRQVSMTVECFDTSAASTHEDALRAKVAKLHREGGTLKWTRKDGSVRIFDLLASDGYTSTIDIKYLNGRAEVSLSFMALPGMRGTEQDLGDNVETTLPALVFTEASIPGDLTALGRLVIDNDAATDQWWAIWGLESRNYSSSANAALFYEAEGRTAMGGSAIAAGPSGASGAGSNVMRNTSLSTSYLAILSTQATGGGAHLSHVGTFRVLARVHIPTANTGTVSVALEWGEGDFRRFTRNTATNMPAEWEGAWRLLDLGLVTLTATTSGTQRWEGRIVAKSTVAGDDIDVDCLFVVPVAEGSGEISAVIRSTTPSVFTARDEFDQTAGALAGKTLPAGGTWSGAGSATDFSVAAGAVAQRTTTADSGASLITGRFARAGASTLTNSVVQADMRSSADTSSRQGVFARYTDVNNHIRTSLRVTPVSSDGHVVVVYKTVAGTDTQLGLVLASSRFQLSTWYTVRLYVDAVGRWAVSVYAGGSPVLLGSASGLDSSLATGGTLASGGFGIYDYNSSGVAATRDYDNFFAFAPAADAAIFASQSVEVSHDRVVREDSTGTLWQTPSSYVGDYLRVPPSGAEGRTTRVIVKTSRFGVGELGDPSIDDVSARLFVTPRYL